MSDSQQYQAELHKRLWDMANSLRGQMEAYEFKNYILGIIFYRYLSEQVEATVSNTILAHDPDLDYQTVWNIDSSVRQNVSQELLDILGFLVEPQYLFSSLIKEIGKGAQGNFDVELLSKAISSLMDYALGAEHADDFRNLFDDMDLESSKLGNTVARRSELVAEIMIKVNSIPFAHADADIDILGDAYEYMIYKFAATAGKSAGEFYTPQKVSSILAKIVSHGKDRLSSVYDPTCGSGSLLLRVAKEAQVDNFYGQELTATTFNLARMNMMLHGVPLSHFDIRNGDTLREPAHLGKTFEAIVANPPYSARWSADPNMLNDERFADYGKLAPRTKADFAFVQHIVAQLEEGGTAAVVLPHGVLFRGAAEGTIRRTLIENKNYIDAVIGLPANLFFGTDIPTCILVLKKGRKDDDKVLFVDASQEFEKGKKGKNTLTDTHVAKIVGAYASREDVAKFSREVDRQEIADNDYNLNIPRYIDTFEAEEKVDLAAVVAKIATIDAEIAQIDAELEDYFAQLVSTVEGDEGGVQQRIFSRELVFKDDNGNPYPEWEEVRLGDVATKITEKNKDFSVTHVLTNSARDGLVPQTDFFDKQIANNRNIDSYYVIRHDDFVYNPRISSEAPYGPVNRYKGFTPGVVSPLYLCFSVKGIDKDYLGYYFGTSGWHRHLYLNGDSGARSDRVNIKDATFFELKIPVPSLPEQKKIAALLSAMDAKIDKEAQKLDALKEQKKGYMQRMFV